MIKKTKILLTFLIVISTGFTLGVEDEDVQYEEEPARSEVGIDEKLGEFIPLDLSFLDETGKPVSLRSLFTKPTLLTLVYYRCPGICSPLLTGVSTMIDRLDMEPGKDYNLVTISFNPREDYIMAAGKKQNYTDNLKKKIPQESWKFLTGDSASIAAITDAVGFRYQPQGEDYMHGAVVTVISQKGMIARYLYGTDFLPMDVKLAITEASEGRSTPAINKLLKLCFSYDPAGRTYVLNFTRIVGGGMIMVIIGFVLVLTLTKKKKKNHNIPVGENGKGNTQNG